MLHKELNILKVKDIHASSVLHFAYNCINGTPVPAFENYYIKRHFTHHHNTRHSNAISIKRYRTELGKSTTHNVGANLWNELPDDLKCLETLNSFKNKTRCHLMSAYSS